SDLGKSIKCSLLLINKTMQLLKNIILTLTFCALISSIAVAQHAYFAQQGTIHYDKTIFIKNLMKRYASYESDSNKAGLFHRYIDPLPENSQYKITHSMKMDETLLEYVSDEQPQLLKQLAMMWIFESGIDTYKNFKTKGMRSLFELGGQTFHIQDSLVLSKWRITNEYRNI